ncbi:hypothetical protein BB560_001327 [Smittium megazygosporum]|uniref:Complex 1 LYR protein domain-containing protein n=1 Tax=Smittium megazygosporum TaxID=133381 RepID=A0A2T9ZHX6_9FUNG|nr:hypothetical protein BB560_001327 [Smittium megazygosporum]
MPIVHSVNTVYSKTLAETRARTIHLYRTFQKAVPTIVKEYRFNYPSAELRKKIRAEFERNKAISDIGAINIALFKGETEYEEIVNCWKQINHFQNYFDEGYKPKPQITTDSNFVQRFLEGKA